MTIFFYEINEIWYFKIIIYITLFFILQVNKIIHSKKKVHKIKQNNDFFFLITKQNNDLHKKDSENIIITQKIKQEIPMFENYYLFIYL